MTTSAPRIIKAADHPHVEGSSSYNFLDLRQRCEQYAANVKAQCRSWVAEAQDEVEAIRDNAYKEGHAAGMRDGLSDAAEQITARAAADAEQRTQIELEHLTPALEQATAALDQERQRWRARWERQAIELAIALAGHLTNRAIEVDPTVLVNRIQSALEMATGQTEALLHLHPADIESLGEAADRIVTNRPVEVVSDSRVERGGCVIATQNGEIDAQLPTQLERIAEELLGDAI